ncbi:MAG: ECF transporter S component [Thaumarchaeota archaeon]|nr:ECF transporter S component [Nitrososphaerota archaeon]
MNTVNIESSINRISGRRFIAALSLFSALAVVLRASPLRIPAPFAPFLIFEIWEVPIVLALLLLGPKGGYGAGIVVLLLGSALSGGPLPTGQLYNFVAFSSMMAGIIAAKAVYTKLEKILGERRASRAVLATVFGLIVRVGIMAPLMSILLPMPFPLGFSIPARAMPATITSIVLFNSIVSLYTVPLAYAVIDAVTARTKTLSWIALSPSLRIQSKEQAKTGKS